MICTRMKIKTLLFYMQANFNIHTHTQSPAEVGVHAAVSSPSSSQISNNQPWGVQPLAFRLSQRMTEHTPPASGQQLSVHSEPSWDGVMGGLRGAGPGPLLGSRRSRLGYSNCGSATLSMMGRTHLFLIDEEDCKGIEGPL